jgi:hypothetical protein
MQFVKFDQLRVDRHFRNPSHVSISPSIFWIFLSADLLRGLTLKWGKWTIQYPKFMPYFLEARKHHLVC